MKKRTPFTTGSHAYGIPTEKSDFDIVMCCSLKERVSLYKRFCFSRNERGIVDDASASEDQCLTSFSFYKDNINFIVVDEDNYDVWYEATQELIEMRPVTREQAVTLIKCKLNALKESK